MNRPPLKAVLEATLLAAAEPVSLDRLQGVFDGDLEPVPSREDLRAALAELAAECEGRGVELSEVASGWRLQVRREFAPWVNRLWGERPTRYSRALLETLAIIAYRQPVTRGEIEDIRGVAVSSNIIKTLSDRDWIRVAGYRDVPGRPAVYATTRQFLDYFNLKSLSDLPPLAALRDFEELAPDLFAAAAAGGESAGEGEFGAEGEEKFEVGSAARVEVEGQPEAGTEPAAEAVVESAGDAETEAGARTGAEAEVDLEVRLQAGIEAASTFPTEAGPASGLAPSEPSVDPRRSPDDA